MGVGGGLLKPDIKLSECFDVGGGGLGRDTRLIDNPASILHKLLRITISE